MIWFVVTWETSILISILAVLVRTSTNNNKDFSFPTTSSAFAVRLRLGEGIPQSSFNLHSLRDDGPPCFSRQGLSLRLELNNWATLPGEWVPQICSSLPFPVPQLQMRVATSNSYVDDGNPNSGSHACTERCYTEPTPQPTRGPFFFKPSLSVKNQRLKLVRVQSLNLSDQLNQLLDNTSFGSVHKTMDNHSNRKLPFTSWLSLGKRVSRKTSVDVLITTPAHIPLCSPKDS